ncbi:MAG: DNA methyltransferase [Thermomicrobiales bacterium]
MSTAAPGRRDRLTFKGNLKETRYGWLRLTPAYSVHLVADLLDAHAAPDAVLLDPFCGTGTTALVCAERGVACDTTDINPFLIWLTRAKTRPYAPDQVTAFVQAAERVAAAMANDADLSPWTPPMHQIEKWWDAQPLAALGRAMAAIRELAQTTEESVVDLLKLAFCRVMIESSHASFGHQSMSFRRQATGGRRQAADGNPPSPAHRERGLGDEGCSWRQAVAAIAQSAQSPIAIPPRALLCDARTLADALPPNHYDLVVTSPPYPNRMSYIRELRPYMYWLGYLRDGRQAGELDWQAIGGTWGIATSNVAKWTPNGETPPPVPGLDDTLTAIARRGDLLARYVHKYVADMATHCRELFAVVKPGGAIHYVVGNSKFYDVLLPTEQIFVALFAAAGFVDLDTRILRKRTSKKELFEYLVTAHKPGEARSA